MMKNKKPSAKEIEEKILKISIEIAREGNGALFILGDNVKYEKLIKQRVESFSIFDSGAEKVLKGLAVIDGAVIVDPAGKMVDYGVLIKNTSAFLGFGTRHAAAMTASKNNNIAILVSEEERKVKIFRNGKYIMQIDSLQKGVEKSIPLISKVLESAGAGLIGTIGTAVIAPTLGIALIPGIIIFGASYMALRAFLERYRVL